MIIDWSKPLEYIPKSGTQVMRVLCNGVDSDGIHRVALETELGHVWYSETSKLSGSFRNKEVR